MVPNDAGTQLENKFTHIPSGRDEQLKHPPCSTSENETLLPLQEKLMYMHCSDLSNASIYEPDKDNINSSYFNASSLVGKSGDQDHVIHVIVDPKGTLTPEELKGNISKTA